MANASQFYVPGPAYVFTNTGTSQAWEFLAFCESDVTPEFMPLYDEVQVDYAGSMLPGEIQMMGRQAFIPLRPKRYDEIVLQKLLELGQGTVGSISAGEIGQLMIANNFFFHTLVYCANAAAAEFSAHMVPGYLFNGCCYIADRYRMPMSTRVKVPEFAIRCLPNINPLANTGAVYTLTLPSPLPTPV